MSSTIISVLAPAYVVNDIHNQPFHKTTEPQFEEAYGVDNQVFHDGNQAPLLEYGTLCITTDHTPNDTTVGFVFGPDKAICDVWLPSEPTCQKGQHFAIQFDEDTGALTMVNLSEIDMWVSMEPETKKLSPQESIPQETITMFPRNMNIKLIRRWDNTSIDSPLNTLFRGELFPTDAIPELLRCDSKTASSVVSSVQSWRAKHQHVYKLTADIKHGVLPQAVSAQCSECCSIFSFFPWYWNPEDPDSHITDIHGTEDTTLYHVESNLSCPLEDEAETAQVAAAGECGNADTINDNGAAQVSELPDSIFVWSRYYSFFKWRGEIISYTGDMVNFTQIFKVFHRKTHNNPAISAIIRDNRLIMRGKIPPSVAGYYIFYYDLIKIFRRFNLDLTGLPDFILSLDRDRHYEGIEYFMWKEKRITDRLDLGRVNLTQMLEAANKSATEKIRQLLLRDKDFAFEDNRTKEIGTFVVYEDALKVCTDLGIPTGNLPRHILKPTELPDELVHWFKWQGQSAAHFPHKGVVKLAHIFTPMGFSWREYSRNRLEDAVGKVNISVRKGHPSLAGWYAPYKKVIAVVEQMYPGKGQPLEALLKPEASEHK